jgi:hypothetical protein
MRTAYCAYLETYALLTIFAKVAVPQFRSPEVADVLYDAESVEKYMTQTLSKVCTFYASAVLAR